MRIDDIALQEAVLQIFVDYHVRAHGRLDLADLQARWPQYRVRREDLAHAIALLAASGDLVVRREQDRFYLEITAPGHERATKLPAVSVRDWWRLLSTKTMLEVAAHRTASSGDASPRRRRGDRTAEAA